MSLRNIKSEYGLPEGSAMIIQSLIQRLGMVQVVIIITTIVLTLIHVLEPARSLVSVSWNG